MKRTQPLCALLVILSLLAPAAMADPWPQFWGPNRDGKSAETGLLKSWPAEGPRLLWVAQVDLGEGYSSLCVTGEAIYTTGVFGRDGYVIAMDLSGKPKWKTKYGPEWTKNFPASRTTPTFEDGRLYVMSGVGRIVCLDAAEGRELWAVDTRQAYGSQDIRWGLAESPLICDEKVLCTPAGTKASVVALDKKTGKEIWATNVDGELGAYCSPVRIKDGRKDIVVTMLGDHTVGLETATGKLLWKTPYSGPYDVHANNPLYHAGRVYVTGGYDTGGLMLGLAEDGRSVQRLWTDLTLDCHHGGVMLIDGHLYGSNWISNAKGSWICLDWQTGKVKFDTAWSNKGTILAAEGMMYVYTEKGDVGLVRPDPSEWKVVSSFKITEGKGNHWAYPALSNGRLYIRHGGALMAYDIRAGK